MMASYPESLVMFRAEQEKRRVRLRSGTAFAFDINGVLLHSDAALPGATEILRHLRDIGVLFLFLTNSGGAHERHRIERISQQLLVPFSEDQFVQSDTPIKAMVEM
jgi:ribonucleotide monophosphatase NagD (HAD superfamily)